MKNEQFTCDICGVLKKDTNHWFKICMGDAFHLYTWDYLGEGGDDTSILILHVCGRGCAIKALDKYMGGTKNWLQSL